MFYPMYKKTCLIFAVLFTIFGAPVCSGSGEPVKKRSRIDSLQDNLKHQSPFKPIGKTQNEVCIFPQARDVNVEILNLLDPQSVKAIMGSSRQGYWLGRLRGYVRFNSHTKGGKLFKNRDLIAFLEYMCAEPNYPLKTLDMTNVDKPSEVFRRFDSRILQTLGGNLTAYISWSKLQYNTAEVLDLLPPCPKLKALTVSDLYTPRGRMSYQEWMFFTQRMTVKFSGLEYLYLTDSRFNGYDGRQILLGFKSLRVLYMHSCQRLSDLGQLPLLQELGIDAGMGGEVDNQHFDRTLNSLGQSCPNLSKLDLTYGRRDQILVQAKKAFDQLPNLKEIVVLRNFGCLPKDRVGGSVILHRNLISRKISVTDNYLHVQMSHLQFYSRLRELFPDVGPIQELTFLARGPFKYTKEQLISISENFPSLRTLNLPVLDDYPMNTLPKMVANLTLLEEMDLSANVELYNSRGFEVDLRDCNLDTFVFAIIAQKVKRLNISYRPEVTADLVTSMLELETLERLTLSYIDDECRSRTRVKINAEQVQKWREEFPKTQIIVEGKLTAITKVKKSKPDK